MNRKIGLDYFSFDIDFFQDEKIQFISARFGIKGESITIRLLCKIYRNGYYIDWNDDIALLFAKSVGDGCQHSFVKDIVYELLKRGFFDKSIFERFSILTSRGIQNRYFEASLRRKEVFYDAQLLLIDISKYQNVIEITENDNIKNENVDILKQSKVKESKRKESNNTPLPPLGEQEEIEKETKKSENKDKLNKIWTEHENKLSLDIRKKILEWIQYKKEKGKSYKPQGLNSLLVQLEKKLKLYDESAVIEIIDESMASNYQGILWDKLEKGGNKFGNSRAYSGTEKLNSNRRESTEQLFGTIL